MSIEVLPNNGYAPSNADIAAHLDEQAEWLLADDAKPVRNVFLVFEMMDGSISRQTCGAPCDLARAMGVLAMAISQAST